MKQLWNGAQFDAVNIMNSMGEVRVHYINIYISFSTFAFSRIAAYRAEHEDKLLLFPDKADYLSAVYDRIFLSLYKKSRFWLTIRISFLGKMWVLLLKYVPGWNVSVNNIIQHIMYLRLRTMTFTLKTIGNNEAIQAIFTTKPNKT